MSRLKELGVTQAAAAYDQLAPVYDANVHSFTPDKRYLDEFFNRLPRGGKLLDVGSGTADIAAYAQYTLGFSVIGVEPSPEMLNIVDERYPNLYIFNGDSHHLYSPWPGKPYDGIMANYSYIHLPNTDELTIALAKARRIMMPGGYHFMSLQAPLNEEDESGLRAVRPSYDPNVELSINLFTPKQVKDCLRRAGLQPIKMESRRPEVGEHQFRKLFVTSQKAPDFIEVMPTQ